MTIQLTLDSATGYLKFPDPDPISGGGGSTVVESLGSVTALTDEALADKFTEADGAQPGDIIYIDGSPYRMKPDATDARLAASWARDTTPTDGSYVDGSTSVNPLTHAAIARQFSTIEDAIEDIKSAPLPTTITWDDLPETLVANQRFTKPRSSDGAEWLFKVPAEIAGEDKGAVWGAAEEERYVTIGEAAIGEELIYLDTIRFRIRSTGTNAGSRFGITFYDIKNNPIPHSNWVFSGQLTQWTGGSTVLNYDRQKWAGTLGIGRNKLGYLNFYWDGGEAQLNGLGRIEVHSLVATSVGPTEVIYVNAPGANYSSPGQVPSTRVTTRALSLIEISDRVQALEVADGIQDVDITDLATSNRFIPVPPEGLSLGAQYFAIANAAFADVVAEQIGETVFIVNDHTDPITLTPPSLGGAPLQVMLEDGTTAAAFTVASGETAGFRLFQQGADYFLREFPNDFEIAIDDTFPLEGNTSENPVQSQLVAQALSGFRRVAPATGAELGTDYAATEDLRLEDLVTEQVGQATVIVNEGADPIVVTPGGFGGLQSRIVFGSDLSPTGDFRNEVTLLPGDRLRVELIRPEGGGHVIQGEFLEPAFAADIRSQLSEAGGQPTIYGAIADLPAIAETANGTMAWVVEDSTPALNGMYVALGPVGAQYGNRWQRVILL